MARNKKPEKKKAPTLKELLIAALIKGSNEPNPLRRKKITKEIAVILNVRYKSRDMKALTRKYVAIASNRKLPKESGEKNFIGVKDWKMGKSRSSSRRKTTEEGSAVKNKKTSEKGIADTYEELKEIAHMNNEEIVKHFGGISKVKAFSKTQGYEVSHRLAGDKFLDPFRSAVMKHLGKIAGGSEEEE